MRRMTLRAVTALLVGCVTASAAQADSDAVERGRQALLERSFLPPSWSTQAYDRLGRFWSSTLAPDSPAYAEAVRERYGLHVAPYENGKYPMGLRRTGNLLLSGITSDCMLCHGGSIAGKSYVGLGNSTLDIQALFEDLGGADGRPRRTPFVFSNVRGTSEAGAMAVFLLSWREPNLELRGQPLDLDLHVDLCEDVPAWWLLKKKKTIYHTGSTDARSVRTLMQFMLTPLNTATTIQREESTFADIQAYLRSLEPPPYPFAIDQALAHRGEGIFENHCARCHGTYGEHWTYPNRIVPIDEIGTDRARLDGLTARAGQYYNRSWFGHEKSGWFADDYAAMTSDGYQAPPLDGIWATAPYFHNGSVPTVYDVLNSRTRPAVYTRSFRTDASAYDPVKLGWKVQVLPEGSGAGLSPAERRKIYDTSLPGRGRGGHTFGDRLTEEERTALIEYLKTL